MNLNEITAQAGARKRRKRVGRGESSGAGKTCGRGHKGCQSRSGGGTRPLYEGGQMPLFRRVPKRGFSNVKFATPVDVLNLGRLDQLFNDGDDLTIDVLRAKRLVNGGSHLVKILAKGDISKKLTIHAHAFSASAREAIEKAGGTAKLIERIDAAAQAKAKRFSAKKARLAKAGKTERQEAAPEAPKTEPADS